MTFHLAGVAPRLAKARDQLVALRKVEAEQERQRRERLDKRQLHLLWLVDHRDLQAVRALSKGNGPYIARRRRLLEEARAELAAFLAKRYPPGPTA